LLDAAKDKNYKSQGVVSGEHETNSGDSFESSTKSEEFQFDIGKMEKNVLWRG
jgi:hypothetical protein